MRNMNQLEVAFPCSKANESRWVPGLHTRHVRREAFHRPQLYGTWRTAGYLAGQTAVGISVDCVDNFLYWSDIAGNTINRARYDGTEIEAVLREGSIYFFVRHEEASRYYLLCIYFAALVPSAEGLAVDHASHNIFWTDSQNDHIAVAKLTDMKAGYKVIISKNLTNPRAIAVHPERG